MEIYLIRHGQTTGDVEDRYGGNYDDHLSSEGKTQAQQLAEKLKDRGIKVILCSPLIRAQETAEILKASGSKVQTLDDLRERNQYGVLTGLVKSEAKEKFPKLVEDVKDYRKTIEGAEPYDEFKARVEKLFNEIISMPHNTLAVLTHGGIIRVIFREILKAGEIDVADCAYAILNKEGSSITVEKQDGIESRTD